MAVFPFSGFDHPNQFPGGDGSHVVQRLANRGQGRDDHPGQLQIVIAHNGQILGDLDAMLGSGRKGGHGHLVAGGENRGKVGVVVQKSLHRLAALLKHEITVGDIGWI
ncbi:hypothetical protein D1872_312930 [compost metagenome]